jgi:hypothetical protein
MQTVISYGLVPAYDVDDIPKELVNKVDKLEKRIIYLENIIDNQQIDIKTLLEYNFNSTNSFNRNKLRRSR